MPIYAFKCISCGQSSESTSRTPITCPCGSLLRRDYRFSIASSFTPHYNHSVGKFVHNQSEFHSALRRASDNASEATGTEHNYVPIDAADVAKSRKSDEGLYEQAKRHRDLGWTEASKKTFT